MSNGNTATDHAMSDNELVALYQQHPEDQEYFNLLYARTNRRIFGLCLRMTGCPATAEDLTQEVYLQLHRKIFGFRGDSAFTTWLHRVAVNCVLMHLRKKRLATVSLDDPFDDPDGGSPVSTQVATKDLPLASVPERITLLRLIGKLSPGYREAFMLHEVEGYQHREIAAMNGYTVGNSKSQLYKARQRLRNALK